MKTMTTTKTPGLEKVSTALVEAFGKIEAKLLKELKTAYRDHAKEQFDYWVKCAQDKANEGNLYGGDFHRFVDYDYKAAEKAFQGKKKFAPTYIGSWDQVRECRDFLKPDYKQADKDAKESYDRAKESFVGKNTDKMTNVLGGNDVAAVTISFEWRNRCFQGVLVVKLPSGSKDEIVAEISLKFVIRRIPHVTPYYQYPLNFTSATIKGVTHARPSEEELRLLLGGGPAPTPEELAIRKGYCRMTGTVIKEKYDRDLYCPYVRCPACGVGVSAKTGKYRAHVAPVLSQKVGK